MAYKTAGSCYNYIGTMLHSVFFLFVANSVVSSVYGNATDIGKMVGKSLLKAEFYLEVSSTSTS